MKLGVCAQVFYNLDFETALDNVKSLGCKAIELPVDSLSPFIDLEQALERSHDEIRNAVDKRGLEISALSNHQEGQLLFGPHGNDTDRIYAGDAMAKIEYATVRLKKTAELAARLGVKTVCGFTGCEDYSRWFPWPDPNGYEKMANAFRERLLPILDYFGEKGVCFAHECHPKQFAYNVETAIWALELVDNHEAFGFNFDPANLLLADVDPVIFISELGERIKHVHAKDGERVTQNYGRSGLLAHGDWSRPDRGFRFRVPGWGDLPWKKLITELHLKDYSGVLSIEHEDPTMSRKEGLQKAYQYLEPLLLREKREERWW